MKLKTLFTIVLLVFVAVSVIVLVGKELKEPAGDSVTEGISGSPSDEHGEKAGEAKSGTLDHKLIVYYFHATTRCPTCLKLEAYSKEVVETKYTDELEAGAVEFQVVNFDESRNQHFISDYSLAFGSLVLVSKRGNEESFVNLERIWDLVHDKPAFSEYVGSSIDSTLAAL